MPNHKSCAKRMRTSNEQRLRSRALRSQVRKAIKELRTETDKESAEKKYREVTSFLDKAASHNIIHKKNADRNKSRLAHLIQKIS